MQDFSQCPPELQKINKAGDVIGCFNIHVAAADDEMKKGAVHGAYLSQIWNDPEAWSRTACDALVGDCGGQSVNETLYSGNHIKRGSLLARANDGGNRTGYICDLIVDMRVLRTLNGLPNRQKCSHIFALKKTNQNHSTILVVANLMPLYSRKSAMMLTAGNSMIVNRLSNVWAIQAIL